MRDDQAAIEYLTGALTGGARPAAVGLKFTEDGAPLSCPGYTTICHVDPASDAFRALVSTQDILKAGSLASAFTFMPADSLHMTLFEGVIDYARTADRWPAHLPLNATIAQATEDAAARLKGHCCQQKFKVRPIQVFGGFTVVMAGATKQEEDRLRLTRNALRDALNLHRPDHDAYQFHVTLAYLLRWLSRDEAQDIIELSHTAAQALLADMPELTLGPAELCVFETMHRFERMMYLDN